MGVSREEKRRRRQVGSGWAGGGKETRVVTPTRPRCDPWTCQKDGVGESKDPRL